MSKTKTTRTRAKPSPVVVNADMNLVAKTIQDYAYAQEDHARDMLAALFSNPGMAAMIGPPGYAESLVAFTTYKAASHVLKIEDNARRYPHNPTNDVERAKLQYRKALASARKSLGANFDRLYEESRVENNKSARLCLDQSKGKMYYYVVPKFNDDGTHDPLGPKDFPWGTTP